MYTRFFIAVLPALLGSIAPSLALPIPSSQSLSIEARSFNPSFDADVQFSRDIVADYLVEREYQNDEYDLFSRAIYEDIFPRAGKQKLTAEEAQARKEKVKTDVAKKQADNAAKKTQRAQEFKALEKNGKPHYYPVPKKVNYQKKALPDGTEHITKGYRAIEREKGTRVAKQPKTPHADFTKGEQATDAKAKASQEAANLRQQQKKAADNAKYSPAVAIHKETMANGNMPARTDEFHVPNSGVLTGKDVRQAAFNLALHNGDGGKYPVGFKNQEQGPANDRHVPLPHMNGPGQEYPIQNGGYHPGDANLGPARGIFQQNVPTSTGAHGGYNLQGVLAHDINRVKGQPGYNDHIPVPVTHAGAAPDPVQLNGHLPSS